jgi:wyosine [tRNA(Phe)-imidazoG37] synthetase (radical SAM superfamily)
MPLPSLVVSDLKGNIFEIPELVMSGSSINSNVLPDDKDIIALPKSSVLYTLPKRIPVGYDKKQNKFIEIREYNGRVVNAVSAFMPPGFIRTLHPSYTELKGAPRLPLYCYSATGFKDGKFVTAGYRIDSQRRHEINEKLLKIVNTKSGIMLKRYSNNRLVSHLINNCVYKYSCPNACNFVLERWECPVPVSISCNSECLGCISKQPCSSGFQSSQERISFTPTVQEILEYVIPHLKNAGNPIVSFGQGCEGEPLRKVKLIEETIIAIRSHTKRGIINLNTNGSLPYAVERLCKAGLDSIRISMNSAQELFYNLYYRPNNYSFNDVIQSIKIAKQYNKWLSINYLMFPGFTDTSPELHALKNLIRSTNIDMIQTRNLNIDPSILREIIINNNYSEKSFGIIDWIEELKKSFPDLLLGYFNPAGRMMHKNSN